MVWTISQQNYQRNPLANNFVACQYGPTVTEGTHMANETREMVRRWIDLHRGDAEAVARWMSKSLRVGGLAACRAIVKEAQA